MTERLRAIVVLSILALASEARAFPAFARKTGMSCTACHVAWPILNQQGTYFRDNGYQIGLEKDDPVTISSAYVPFAIRSTAAYQYARATNQTSDAGPVEVKSGGVGAPGIDLLTGGVIAKDLSYLVVVAGFLSDSDPANVESAWARLSNIGGTSWLNLRAGKFELDLPASAHRGVTLTSGYAAYGAHPSGSAVGFDMGENQVGLEVDGHSANSATRYSLSLVSASGDPGSSNAWSSPLLYGHLQHAFDLDNSVVPWLRLGILGAVGWWPTAFATDGATPIPGTGRQHKKYTRLGAELTWIFGYPATPFLVTAAYLYGREDAGLASGIDPTTGIDLATQANSFNGAFVEVDWVPVSAVAYNATPWMIFARYDAVRYKVGAGDVDGFTIGVRRYLAFGPRASLAFHLEFHSDKTRGVGWVDPAGSGAGLDVTAQALLAGFDFAF